MSFTDDDLKRLKDEFSKLDGKFESWNFVERDGNILKALIARLEAAEKCVADCLADENCCQAWPVEGPSHADEWRRAKGE